MWWDASNPRDMAAVPFDLRRVCDLLTRSALAFVHPEVRPPPPVCGHTGTHTR